MSVNTFLSSSLILIFAVSKAMSLCCDPGYPVALDNLGPRPCPLPIVGTVQSTPIIEKPPVYLPARIPYPRTISNKCRCVKTVVKPQVIHQVINVPTVQRYIETRHRPVVEKIHYNAYPVNAGYRNIYGNCVAVGDGEYADCCYRDVCHIPVTAALPCTANIPVRTAVPVAAALPVARAFPVRACYESC